MIRAKGSPTVKALCPFVQMPDDKFWSFLDLHAAKLPRDSRVKMFICTSFHTHDSIARWNVEKNGGRAVLIRGNVVTKKIYPTRSFLEKKFAQEPKLSDEIKRF